MNVPLRLTRSIRRLALGSLMSLALLSALGCNEDGNDTTDASAPSASGGGTPGMGGGSTEAGGASSPGMGGSLAGSGGSTGSGSMPVGGGSATTGGGTASGGAMSGGGPMGSGSSADAGGSTATDAGSSTDAGGSTGVGSMPSAGCGISDWLKSGRSAISVSGTNREYILKIPDNYDTKHAYKLIFAFHARGGNASGVAGGGNDNYYGLHARAAGSAIFVSPEGLDAGWRNTDGRDINFVKAMLDHFSAKLCIDKRRIFATGFSFGGMMSDAIGCAMGDVFRAIAPMAGGYPNAEHPYSGCDQPNMHPIAVWMAHGDNDTTVPLADGKMALDLFVKRSGCQQQTKPVMPSPCVAYEGCMADYPIHFCQFQGGHAVPSFASAAIWTFFNQF